MSGFQLTPPFSGQGGFRQPVLPVPQLSLGADFTASLLGWSVLAGNWQVYNLFPALPAPGDTGLQNALGGLSQAQSGATANPQAGVPSFLKSLGPQDWDVLYGLARQLGASTWADIPTSKANIVTGQPAAGGKIDGSGTAIPTQPGSAIAGFGLPLPAIKIGKRYPFASGLDVHLYMYVDKDAFSRDLRLAASGGGIGFETKTSDGTILKLRAGAGRDQAGGAAGFIRLQIGPDYGPQPTQ